MNKEQWQKMKEGKGFIAALDQSKTSTPRTLENYGISKEMYHSDEEMFDLIHEFRKRIITSPSFSGDKILGVILFKHTMDKKIDGKYTADYLWDVKGIVPFLKVDKGLEEVNKGVRLMKPIKDLDNVLDVAIERHIFGTKMRSLIVEANREGIHELVNQQFELAQKIIDKGLVPILEPEIDIHSEDKIVSEKILRQEILDHLNKLPKDVNMIFKLSIPDLPAFYQPLILDGHVLRTCGLSGGYRRDEANDNLREDYGMIATYSRALIQDLNIEQSDKEFDMYLKEAIDSIYNASIT